MWAVNLVKQTVFSEVFMGKCSLFDFLTLGGEKKDTRKSLLENLFYVRVFLWAEHKRSRRKLLMNFIILLRHCS